MSKLHTRTALAAVLAAAFAAQTAAVAATGTDTTKPEQKKSEKVQPATAKNQGIATAAPEPTPLVVERDANGKASFGHGQPAKAKSKGEVQ